MRGDTEGLLEWMDGQGVRWLVACGVVTAVGCGAYGTTIGLWRDGTQSIFTAIKFPLLVFLTCGGNALLNGALGLVLGSGLGFRQTTAAILMSFAVAALVLAAFAPLMLFLLWNTPPLVDGNSKVGHSVTLLAHVVVIAFAGFVGNRCLYSLLKSVCPSRAAARVVLLGWLAGNLLLGSQLSWVLRPFIGSPNLPVQFLRDDPMRGNFFEAVARAVQLLTSN
ncbi:MAG: hypothetical protein WA771_06190 [Chthoniobacterales bacterium]